MSKQDPEFEKFLDRATSAARTTNAVNALEFYHVYALFFWSSPP